MECLLIAFFYFWKEENGPDVIILQHLWKRDLKHEGLTVNADLQSFSFNNRIQKTKIPRDKKSQNCWKK